MRQARDKENRGICGWTGEARSREPRAAARLKGSCGERRIKKELNV